MLAIERNPRKWPIEFRKHFGKRLHERGSEKLKQAVKEWFSRPHYVSDEKVEWYSELDSIGYICGRGPYPITTKLPGWRVYGEKIAATRDINIGLLIDDWLS